MRRPRSPRPRRCRRRSAADLRAAPSTATTIGSRQRPRESPARARAAPPCTTSRCRCRESRAPPRARRTARSATTAIPTCAFAVETTSSNVRTAASATCGVICAKRRADLARSSAAGSPCCADDVAHVGDGLLLERRYRPRGRAPSPGRRDRMFAATPTISVVVPVARERCCPITAGGSRPGNSRAPASR